MTSVSSSRSCARLRRSLLSDLQPLNHTAAAPAITPAFQTVSMKVCSWHTHRLILPHTCETQLRLQGPGRYAVGENCVNLSPTYFLFCIFFLLLLFTLMGKTCGPTFIITHEGFLRLLMVLVVYALT